MRTSFESHGEFTRNVLALMTGTTVAQAIPIAISPILTRLYTPEDFGILALYTSITMIFSSIASGRYELAILLPDAEEDALNILALGIIIALFVSMILLTLIVLFHQVIAQSLGEEKLGLWLHFVPLSVFFIGLFNAFKYFSVRSSDYISISKATIAKSLLLAIVQITIGFFKSGATGLVVGQVLSNIFANIKLVKKTISKIDFIRILSIGRIKSLAKRYKNFPKFSVWAVIANSLSHHLISILISSFFSISMLGYYSLVQKVLGTPSSLIGSSVSQVFFKAAVNEKRHTGKALKSFDTTFVKLTVIALPSFGMLYLVVEDLFSIAFGEEWRVAGGYAKILIPFFAVRFVSSALSTIMTVFEKQKQVLLLNVTILVASASIIYWAAAYGINFTLFLKCFSVLLMIIYFLALFWYRKIALNEIKN